MSEELSAKERAEIDAAIHHLHESHDEENIGQRLNWLRAGVLGANDGIVSVAGVVVGVSAVTPEVMPVATAGIAALIAGAFSMAGGEYVSVSTQRDTEKALIEKEKAELRDQPVAELAELTGLYRKRGLSPELARKVAEELTRHDALAAHAEIELGIDPNEYTNPWHAALSSFVAFTIGAIIPLAMILLMLAFVPAGNAVLVTALAVLLGLFLTGLISAKLGRAPTLPAIIRNMLMGSATMLATYLIGLAFDTAIM